MQIVDYKPEFAVYFDKLNKDWLEEYFVVEPIDKWVLENPEAAILKDGGKILFAEHDNKIVGAVALKDEGNGIYELTKMAVDRSARGLGGGRMLCIAAIAEAKRLGAKKVMLYSNTRLKSAIAIYRKLGFLEIPLGEGIYERADIKMEMKFAPFTVQDRETLIESFGAVPEELMAAIQTFPREMWQWHPPYNKWSIHENIIHLADSEVAFYFRCRRFIAEPRSRVEGYDQDIWAANLRYDGQNADDALALFTLLRKMTYNLIKDLPGETWQNEILHSEYGPVRMIDWLIYSENHTHIEQMKRVYKAWQQKL